MVSMKDGVRIAYLVLRAWLLHRLSLRGWAERKEARCKLVQREKGKLQSDILALGVRGGGTGSKAADTRIGGWAPDVLFC